MAEGLAILYVIKYKKEVILKPSFQISAFIWLQVQVGSLYLINDIYQTLDRPWQYFIAVHFITFVGISYALFYNNDRYKKYYDKIRLSVDESYIKNKLIISSIVCLVIVYSVVIWYLNVVPISETGLFAAVNNLPDADQARENSFKLLGNWFLLYIYTFIEKSVSPILSAVSGLLLVLSIRDKKYGIAFMSLALLLAAVFPALIYGARGPATLVLLSFVFSVVLYLTIRNKLGIWLYIMPIIILVPAIIITMAKNDQMSVDGALLHTSNVLQRLVVRGNIDNIWHARYVEEYGFHGIPAIPKIAKIMSVEPVDIFNKVGKHYASDSKYVTTYIPSISANASFSILNYAIFGISGHLVSLFILFIVDFIVIFLVKIKPWLLLVTTAALIVPTSSLSFSMWTNFFWTKGFLITPLIVFILGIWVNRIHIHWKQPSN